MAALNDSQLKSMRTMWDNASKAHRALAKLADAKPEQGLLHQGAPSPGPPPALRQEGSAPDPTTDRGEA